MNPLTFGNIVRPLRREVSMIALCVAAGISAAGLNLSRPWLLGRIVGELVRSDPGDRVPGYVGFYLGSWILSWMTGLLIRFASAKVEQRVLLNLRIGVLTHLLSLPPAESERQSQGKIQAYVSSDLPAWSRLYGTVLTQAVHAAVQFVGAAIALTSFDAGLTWSVLPFLLLGSAAPLLISRALIRVNRSAQDAVSDMLETLAGLTRGAVDLIALRTEDWGIRRFRESGARAGKAELRRTTAQGIMQIFGACSEVGAYVLVLSIGGSKVLNGELEIGELVGFLAAIELIFFPARNAGDLATTIQSSLASAARVLEFRSIPVRRSEKFNDGDLTIRDLTFRYPGSERDAIRSVNCTIRQGSTVVILGESGSGKSTFIKLLAGLYEPSGGRIEASGAEEAKRAFVPQEPTLFPASVADNLRLGRAIEPERIRELAERFDMDHRLIGLPDGYDTPIGHNGEGLSGGQKRRAALIRVLLAPGNMMIFDEPTSGLDTENAQRFWDAASKAGRATVIATTHRPEEARHADLVLVFREGRLAEAGSPNELFEQKGIYFDLMQQSQLERQRP
ncbi:hypothetical protein CDO73_07670 [Saccharibacillus sp. O23]|uniref:ABC transporter ATP-binding protein n=1 Tax=Saccharibacillus sp. O23 TaxID=2009338 RepID=UPI000B4E1749|nr:ABC transporter ATP-binding protein [Saccharibacillus sp. O23]OWR31271.1 hypothetical protein CDO73_07670 [Saccharibacillus sp. O23]